MWDPENSERPVASDLAAAPPEGGQLAEILNQCLNAVLVHRDGRLLYVNNAYAELQGYASVAEAMARHTVGISNVHPDDRGVIADRIGARLRGEEASSRYEFRICRPDGTVVWAECLASRITWNGKPALLGIYHDVTNRKRAEEALQRSERLFSTVFMHSPDVMTLSTLRDGVLLDVNEAFLRMHNLRREEVIGRTGLELALWSSAEARIAMVERLQRCERVVDLPSQITLSDGEVCDLSTCAELLRVNGEEMVLFASRDVTERRRAEDRIAHIAHHDPLTGVANRALFQTRLDEAMREDDSIALLCVDLDRFKEVNDSYGHPIGDALLCQVAARLHRNARSRDIVARLGGDEFAVIQRGGKQPGSALNAAERIIDRLGQPFDIGGRSIVVAASVGIAVGHRDGSDPVSLLRAADLALYRAKKSGQGAIVEFRPAIAQEEEARARVERELRSAVANEEFALHFQPLVDLDSNRRVGFEALLRWNHPERGLVGPSEFIGVAEETGLIVPLGGWVLRHACAVAARWPADCKLAVNISPAQLRHRDLIDTVRAALDQSGLPASRLELEVTESVVIQDTEDALATLSQLKAMGVALALDDFGTGYSSMSTLVRFPFDRVKIDRSFIAGLGRRNDCGAIVRAVASLCRSLGLATTAEGIETPEQLALVNAEGCTEVQGFLLGRPASADAISADLQCDLAEDLAA